MAADKKKMAFEFLHILPRSSKPRETGLTFTGDRGRTLNEIRDLVDCAGEFVDMIKISMLTSRLQTFEKVKAKIDLYQENGIQVFPGGMMTELAVLQDKVSEYFVEAKELGFDLIEVSSTDTSIPLQEKAKLVKTASRDYGFKVLGELGSHFQQQAPSVSQTIYETSALLEAGAWKVIIESAAVTAAETEEQGDGRDILYPIVAKVGLDNLIFETSQPYELIKEFGPEINVGNAGAISNVWYIELSRRGISPRVWYGDVGVTASEGG